MGGAEWNGAIALLKAWLLHQPAPMPVAIVLAGAFALVMFIEGVRVNFLPARYTTRPKAVSQRTRESSEIKSFARPYAAHSMSRESLLRARQRIVPKQQAELRRLHSALRPTICHRIKLEMVNLDPVEQPLPLAEQD